MSRRGVSGRFLQRQPQLTSGIGNRHGGDGTIIRTSINRQQRNSVRQGEEARSAPDSDPRIVLGDGKQLMGIAPLILGGDTVANIPVRVASSEQGWNYPRRYDPDDTQQAIPLGVAPVLDILQTDPDPESHQPMWVPEMVRRVGAPIFRPVADLDYPDRVA